MHKLKVTCQYLLVVANEPDKIEFIVHFVSMRPFVSITPGG